MLEITPCTCLVTEPTWIRGLQFIALLYWETKTVKTLGGKNGLNGNWEVVFPVLIAWLTTGFLYLLAVPIATHLTLSDNHTHYLEPVLILRWI